MREEIDQLFNTVKSRIEEQADTYTFSTGENLLSWNTKNNSHFCLKQSDDKINQSVCYFIIDKQKDKVLITYNFNNLPFENFKDLFDNKGEDFLDNVKRHRCLITKISPADEISKKIEEIDAFKEKIIEKHEDIKDRMKFANPDIDLESLKQSPNVIFYGAPGTGKTHAVKKFLKNNDIKELSETNSTCDHKKGYYKWVQFHPSFSYEDFIEGLKPTGVQNDSVNLELVNGVFKDFCKKALNGVNSDIPYYFIVDEINRANLSTVFGEVLSLLEPSYRDKIKVDNDEIRNLIDIQYSALERTVSNTDSLSYDSEQKGKFGIPRNVYFIGMMNDVDKSIDAFDLALRRRFKWIRKDCNYDVIEEVLSKTESNIDGDSIETYINSCKNLNNYISDDSSKSLNLGKSYEFGHSFFLKIIEFLTSKSEKKVITPSSKKLLFDNYLRPTLKEYLRSEVNSEKDLEKKLKEAKDVFTKTDERSK